MNSDDAQQEALYNGLKTALSASSKGRWFLDEHVRKAQSKQLSDVLEKVQNIEAKLDNRPDATTPNIITQQIKKGLADVTESISRTRKEIAAIKSDDGMAQIDEASEQLDEVVQSTETATEDILTAAEQIQETAWLLREEGASDAMCDKLDGLATEIYLACSFQDLTGQRIRKVVESIKYIEMRVTAMMKIWEDVTDSERDTEHEASPNSSQQQSEQTQKQSEDAHLLNGPALGNSGLKQDSVDTLFDETEPSLPAQPENAPTNANIRDNQSLLENIVCEDENGEEIDLEALFEKNNDAPFNASEDADIATVSNSTISAVSTLDTDDFQAFENIAEEINRSISESDAESVVQDRLPPQPEPKPKPIEQPLKTTSKTSSPKIPPAENQNNADSLPEETTQPIQSNDTFGVTVENKASALDNEIQYLMDMDLDDLIGDDIRLHDDPLISLSTEEMEAEEKVLDYAHKFDQLSKEEKEAITGV